MTRALVLLVGTFDAQIKREVEERIVVYWGDTVYIDMVYSVYFLLLSIFGHAQFLLLSLRIVGAQTEERKRCVAGRLDRKVREGVGA